MKRSVIIIYLLFSAFAAYTHNGKKVSTVTLTDVNDVPAKLPYIGQKTFVLFYIDPDVQELSDPLTEAIDSKKYPSDEFGAIGVINCKDTWIPNGIIRNKVKKKQQQYPESVLFLDKKHNLKSSWKTVDENNAMLVYVIGKDASIQYFTMVKSEQETNAIIQKVIQVINENLD